MVYVQCSCWDKTQRCCGSTPSVLLTANSRGATQASFHFSVLSIIVRPPQRVEVRDGLPAAGTTEWTRNNVIIRPVSWKFAEWSWSHYGKLSSLPGSKLSHCFWSQPRYELWLIMVKLLSYQRLQTDAWIKLQGKLINNGVTQPLWECYMFIPFNFWIEAEKVMF